MSINFIGMSIAATSKHRAFFRLIRWPNLVFIALAQWLFRVCIILPVFTHYGVSPVLSDLQFLLVVISTVLIAAGGYIINDYFDVKIDQINKPQRLLVDRVFQRRSAILAHWVLTILGILLGGFVGWWVGRWHLGGVYVISATLLWWYSANLKRQPLIGNVVVSLLTALTIVVVALFEIWILNRPPAYDKPAGAVLTFVILYGGFAFLISMVREIVKDIEDVEGDSAHNCATLPVVGGIRLAKSVAQVFAFVLSINVVVLLIMEGRADNYFVVLYGLLAVLGPLLYIVVRLYRADQKKHYSQLSLWIKWVMLMGILSMSIVYLFDEPYQYFLYG